MAPALTNYVCPGWIPIAIGTLWQIGVVIALPVVLFIGAWLLLLWNQKRKAAKSPLSKQPPSSAVDYDRLLTAVKRQNGKLNSLLLAAGSLNDLPVTVPVNMAVQLAKTHKCLLVDLDTRRNAVARVFDIDVSEQTSRSNGSYPTPLENLYIWPARNFELLRQTNLRRLLDGAAKKYDYILIYAPYLTTLPDRLQIAASAGKAIAFTGHNGTRLRQLLRQANCKVLQEL